MGESFIDEQMKFSLVSLSSFWIRRLPLLDLLFSV